WGPVNFAIQGANFPGQDTNGTTIPVGPQRRSRFQRRLFSEIVDNAKEAGDKVGDVAEKAADKAGGFIKDAIDTISDANDFDVNQNIDLPPINVNKNFNIFKSQIACGPVNADVSADVFADANALVTLGVAAIGTIVPPKVDDFQVVA
ncbi:hypothetical protein MPER_14834, partial [Moniliophthora perniciosa FA553]